MAPAVEIVSCCKGGEDVAARGKLGDGACGEVFKVYDEVGDFCWARGFSQARVLFFALGRVYIPVVGGLSAEARRVALVAPCVDLAG